VRPHPGPAQNTPDLRGVNVVRPRAARSGRSTLTPLRPHGVYGQLSGSQADTRHNETVHDDHLAELEDELGNLATRILPPMRATKYVDREAFAQLNELVGAIARELADADLIPRRLTGTLWFIFTQALAEADHTRSPEEILRYAWDYQDKLQQLFGPWFSSSPPTPGIPRY